MEERGGGGKGKALPHPSPLFYSPHFSRGLWFSFLVLCSKTRLRIVARRGKNRRWQKKKKKKKKKNGERSGPRSSLGRGISFFSILALTICTEISVKNFRQMVLVFFSAPKTGTGLSCTTYKIPVNFSLSLDLKPGTVIQTNGTENFGRLGKNVKKVIHVPRKVLLFSRKFPPGWTIPFEFSPEFPGFPYKQ